MTVAAFASIGAAAADTNILFILDASGSMYGKVGDEAKIVVAKRELRNLLAELPGDAQVGLMTYGATSKSSCGDIQLLSPVGAASDPGSAIEKITPLGKTPIAAALQQSARAFSGLEGQNNNVVLISDGIESCDGDPCAAATALVASGIGVRVNVVGFGLTDEESAALKCIADNGNGKYFSAKDTAGFSDAIKQVVDVAETAASSEPPPAEPPQPVENVVFDDSFEGSALNADTWLVTNANEDAYLVEDGSLLAVSSTPGGVANADIPNIFKYVGTLPDGDYTVTTTLRMEFATGKEQFQLGLFDDGSNYLTASVVANANCCNSTINLKLDKVAGGQATGFDLIAIRLPSADEFSKEANATEQPITLSFIKQGHTFRASVTFVGLKDDAGNQVVVTTDPVTSLRPPKSLVMNLSQAAAVDGETTAYVDEVKITTTK
jgi:Mg-chelatase subunit ChlD